MGVHVFSQWASTFPRLMGVHVSRGTRLRILALLWGCFLARGVFYSVLFPLWEGYDEYAHFAFVQYLAAGNSLPDASTTVSREIEESLKLVPLPWLLRDLAALHLAHDDYWRLSTEERARRQEQLRQLPREWSSQPGTSGDRHLVNWEAQQPPFYYWLLSFPLQAAWNSTLAARVLLLRLLSVAIASCAVPAAFLVARRVLRSDTAGLGIVALITAMPELMVDICRVGNECVALLLYSALMFATLRHTEDRGRAAAVLMALSLGLGLLTKAYFLTALPALAAILAWQLYFNPGARARILCQGVLATAAAMAISGWWYWRNQALTGSWSGLMQDAALGKVRLWKVLAEIPRVDWISAIDSLLFSHIWFGNWSFLQVRSWIYHAFDLVLLAALAGILALALMPQLRSKRPEHLLLSPEKLFVPFAFYAFFWLGLLYHILITKVAQGVSSSAGWYLYCLVPAEALLIVAGLLVISPARIRQWVMPAATISFALLDLYTVHFLFMPYYSGMITHHVDGTLGAFHISQLSGLNWGDLLARLSLHKPWIGAAGFTAVWTIYLAATFALFVVGIQLTRIARKAE